MEIEGWAAMPLTRGSGTRQSCAGTPLTPFLWFFEESDMPTVQIDGPPASVEKKRILVEKLTAAASEVYELAAEKIVVLIRENHPENVGVGGELLLDRFNREGRPQADG